MPQRRNSINKCPFASTWYNSVWTTSVQGQRWCADDDADDTRAPVVGAECRHFGFSRTACDNRVAATVWFVVSSSNDEL
jgi:hypothetical protein